MPLRDTSFFGKIVRGLYKDKQTTSAQIVEIPLGSIVDVAMVTARENLNTFATPEANWVSRPFRVVTTAACESQTIGTSTARHGWSAPGEERTLTFVGFEPICRLRHLLVLARESWAMRTGATLGGPNAEMPPCVPAAAQRYLTEVYGAMAGCLRKHVR